MLLIIYRTGEMQLNIVINGEEQFWKPRVIIACSALEKKKDSPHIISYFEKEANNGNDIVNLFITLLRSTQY